MIPDITTLWVIGFVLLTVFLVNTLIFKPILAVIEARLKAVSDARELAQTAADRARGVEHRVGEVIGKGSVREQRHELVGVRAPP